MGFGGRTGFHKKSIGVQVGGCGYSPPGHGDQKPGQFDQKIGLARFFDRHDPIFDGLALFWRARPIFGEITRIIITTAIITKNTRLQGHVI